MLIIWKAGYYILSVSVALLFILLRCTRVHSDQVYVARGVLLFKVDSECAYAIDFPCTPSFRGKTKKWLLDKRHGREIMFADHLESRLLFL